MSSWFSNIYILREIGEAYSTTQKIRVKKTDRDLTEKFSRQIIQVYDTVLMAEQLNCFIRDMGSGRNSSRDQVC